MQSIKSQAWIFAIATYLFSWSVFGIGSYFDLEPILILGIWGPSLMSLFLTYKYYGKEGLRNFLSRFKRVKVARYWWVLLLFLPAAIHFTGRSLWELFYFRELTSGFWFSFSAIITTLLIPGLGEELGWRGFLLPRLQRVYKPLMATLILALVHLLWHLPTYWLGQGIHNVPFLYVTLFVFPWTIIYNWIYNHSNGSLIFAVGFHTISNLSLNFVYFMPSNKEVPIEPSLLTSFGLPVEYSGPYLSVIGVYWIIALLVIGYGGLKKVNTDL